MTPPSEIDDAHHTLLSSFRAGRYDGARLPRGYAAHLESGTVNGPLNVPAGIRPPRREGRGWRPGGRISTDINGGGPTIRAVTTNGPVNIREN